MARSEDNGGANYRPASDNHKCVSKRTLVLRHEGVTMTLLCSEAMPERSGKRPRDVNELSAQIVDEATGEASPLDPDVDKVPAAVALGRKGGLKSGKARAAKMAAEERSEAARKATSARWARRSDPP